MKPSLLGSTLCFVGDLSVSLRRYLGQVIGIFFFRQAKVSKMINVDRVCPSLNVDFHYNVQCTSGDDLDLQAFIDNSDLLISNQDIIQV